MNLDIFGGFHEKLIKDHIDEYIKLNNNSSSAKFKIASSYPLHEIHEEYLLQKTLFRVLMGKPVPKNNDTFNLCRHKVCSCMTVAILKCRPIYATSGFPDDLHIALAPDINDSTTGDAAHVANEQLAFSVSLALLRAFILADKAESARHKFFEGTILHVPPSFGDGNESESTFDMQIANSLYRANLMNNISTPLLADVFFYFERYHELHYRYTSLKTTTTTKEIGDR